MTVYCFFDKDNKPESLDIERADKIRINEKDGKFFIEFFYGPAVFESDKFIDYSDCYKVFRKIIYHKGNQVIRDGC